jgi:hypothetical protein
MIMKKNNVFLFVFMLAVVSLSWVAQVGCEACQEIESPCFTTALTTGYVFKHDDCVFKQVYGHGIQNIITADGCYYPWEQWGIGAKVSYWRAQGRTTFFRECTTLQEIPLTFYLRKLFDCWCNWQGYLSLGGGVMFVKEKSSLDCVDQHAGIGEFEVGLNYVVCDCFDITGAFRYIFSGDCLCSQKVDVGGFDLRAGIGFSY